MSKSINVILFGNRSYNDIAEVILASLSHVRKVHLMTENMACRGVVSFMEYDPDAFTLQSERLMFVYPNGAVDDFSEVYDGERTLLVIYGCDETHDVVGALTSAFGGIYEMKEQNDWMVVERRKFLHELPPLACLTLSQECQMQMAG